MSFRRHAQSAELDEQINSLDETTTTGAMASSGFMDQETNPSTSPGPKFTAAIDWLKAQQDVQAWEEWDDIPDWEVIREQAISILRDKNDYVDQPRSWTCGPTAVSGTLARKEPMRFAQFVFNLYTTGRFSRGEKDGDKVNKMNRVWKRKVNDKIAEQTIENVDDMIVISMRNSGSWWRRGYDGTQTGEFVNATFPWEAARWTKQLLDWKARKVYWTNFEKDPCVENIERWNNIADRTEDTCAYLLINSGFGLKDEDDAKKGSARREKENYGEKNSSLADRVEGSLPNHWVQLDSPIEVDGDNVRFWVVDHGAREEQVMTLDEFAKAVFTFVFAGRTRKSLKGMR